MEWNETKHWPRATSLDVPNDVEQTSQKREQKQKTIDGWVTFVVQLEEEQHARIQTVLTPFAREKHNLILHQEKWEHFLFVFPVRTERHRRVISPRPLEN